MRQFSDGTTAARKDVKMEQENSFIHTGIKHTNIQDKHTGRFHYTLDQNDYANVTKPVFLPELMEPKDDQPLPGLLQTCFMTLL